MIGKYVGDLYYLYVIGRYLGDLYYIEVSYRRIYRSPVLCI